MERKVTELEKRLIGNGYRLTTKQYGGRKSDKTLSYYYEKGDYFVRLDYKREKVLSCGLKNYFRKELTRIEVEGIKCCILNIEHDINHDNEEWSNVEIKEENGQIIPLELPKESD